MTTRWQPPRPTQTRPVASAACQADVLDLICEGYTNRRIARELGLVENTIKSHAKTLFVALDARDRAHAVALATTGAVDITVLPRHNYRRAA